MIGHETHAGEGVDEHRVGYEPVDEARPRGVRQGGILAVTLGAQVRVLLRRATVGEKGEHDREERREDEQGQNGQANGRRDHQKQLHVHHVEHVEQHERQTTPNERVLEADAALDVEELLAVVPVHGVEGLLHEEAREVLQHRADDHSQPEDDERIVEVGQ